MVQVAEAGASLEQVLSGILGVGNDSGVEAKLFAKTILLDNHRTSTKKKVRMNKICMLPYTLIFITIIYGLTASRYKSIARRRGCCQRGS